MFIYRIALILFSRRLKLSQGAFHVHANPDFHRTFLFQIEIKINALRLRGLICKICRTFCTARTEYFMNRSFWGKICKTYCNACENFCRLRTLHASKISKFRPQPLQTQSTTGKRDIETDIDPMDIMIKIQDNLEEGLSPFEAWGCTDRYFFSDFSLRT